MACVCASLCYFFRLDYRRQENRAFYLALYRHMTYVGSRACYRTALELCKVIINLDPVSGMITILIIASSLLFLNWHSHVILYATSLVLSSYLYPFVRSPGCDPHCGLLCSPFQSTQLVDPCLQRVGVDQKPQPTSKHGVLHCSGKVPAR